MAVHPDLFAAILKKQMVLVKLEQLAPQLFQAAAASTAAGVAINNAIGTVDISSLSSVEQVTSNLLSAVGIDLPGVAVQANQFADEGISRISR